MKPPASFLCPISKELVADPVMLCTGHTYDRVCIERWFSQGEDTCPVTGLTLENFHMTPNHALRNAAQDWAADHGVAIMQVELSHQSSTGQVPVSSIGTILRGHEGIIWAAEVCGQHLFSASADRSIRVWDTTTLRCAGRLAGHGPCSR